MNKFITTIKIIVFYIFISFIIYNVFYYLWLNFIFSCKIETPKDLDCFSTVFNSSLIWFIWIILFMIIDIWLIKTYKKIKLIWKKT